MSFVVIRPATNWNVYYICVFFFLRKSPVTVFVNDSTTTAAEIHWFNKRVAKVLIKIRFINNIVYISMHFLADLWETSLPFWRNLVAIFFSSKKNRNGPNQTEQNQSKLNRTKPRRNDFELALLRARYFQLWRNIIERSLLKHNGFFFLPRISVLWFPLSAADHGLTGNGILRHN